MSKARIVYLVCGVSGSGKSWVCNRLSHLAYYRSVDKEGYVDPTHTVEIQDRTTNIATTIKRYQSQGIDVRPIFILGDFLATKQQLRDRGGKITPNLYRRRDRIIRLAERYGLFAGTPQEVLCFLKDELSHRNSKHTIYCCKSPSGKRYIGKTCQPLDKRIYDHKVLAKIRSQTAFARAILKYGDQLQWSTLETVYGLELANQREAHWIDHYNSADPAHGYNLTVGGDGGKKSPEAELQRRQKIKQGLNRPQVREKLSKASKASWQNEQIKKTMSEGIKQARSSLESRKRTSDDMLNKWQDPEFRKKRIESIKNGSSEETKKKLSVKGLAYRARKFGAYKDNQLIAVFHNQKEAAHTLGIPACGISMTLSGKRSHTNGYEFRYLDEPDTHTESNNSHQEVNNV